MGKGSQKYTDWKTSEKMLAQNGTDATEETYSVDRCSIARASSGEDFASEGQLEAETIVGACNAPDH
jgi:hypothetical protein